MEANALLIAFPGNYVHSTEYWAPRQKWPTSIKRRSHIRRATHLDEASDQGHGELGRDSAATWYWMFPNITVGVWGLRQHTKSVVYCPYLSSEPFQLRKSGHLSLPKTEVARNVFSP